MNASVKGGEMITKLKDCQKKFLFNSRYEPTKWNSCKKTPTYICDKGRVNIYCDIPDGSNLDIDDVIDIHKKMFGEIHKI